MYKAFWMIFENQHERSEKANDWINRNPDFIDKFREEISKLNANEYLHIDSQVGMGGGVDYYLFLKKETALKYSVYYPEFMVGEEELREVYFFDYSNYYELLTKNETDEEMIEYFYELSLTEDEDLYYIFQSNKVVANKNESGEKKLNELEETFKSMLRNFTSFT